MPSPNEGGASASQSRSVRARLLQALRAELMGPTTPDEAIGEYPTSRYLVGRLAPARVDDADNAALLDDSENDTLGAGDEDGEGGGDEPTVPLIIGFHPSSCGLSFLVEPGVDALIVKVSWGDYRFEKGERGERSVWKRYERAGVVRGLPIDRLGPLSSLRLSPRTAPAGVTIEGLDDDEISLEGVVHEFGGYRAVSLFIVNRRTRGAQGDRTKDERWLFQPSMRLEAKDGRPVFAAKDAGQTEGGTDDPEDAATALLYRHAKEFATGHGVAASWIVDDGSCVASAVFTEFIPTFELPQLVAPADQVQGAVLDMQELASTKTGADLVRLLDPLVSAYEKWVAALEIASASTEIQSDPELRDAAQNNLRDCRDCASRIRAGLTLLGEDEEVADAFRFANTVMWDQRIHSLWAEENRRRGAMVGGASDFDEPENRTWRPFQMGFLLLNLRGVSDPTSKDRTAVDLLWFPTGGGKTEAYLGLSAIVLALRRLRGDGDGVHGGAGVSIIMRYTLRLLTVQQFQRAAALIAACELARRRDSKRWGIEPFRIGVWVGRNTTPNTFEDSKAALEDLRDGTKPRGGSPVQLITCPRCGITLATDQGTPERGTYIADTSTARTRIFCRNDACDFSQSRGGDEGLPVVVVDDEIYRTCPSLVVATVDKFARMPFRGETQALFGLRSRFSPTYGHLTEAHGDKVANRKIRDASVATRLKPPDLIIQDELHLISGPLGTMVGLYESAIDFLAGLGAGESVHPPKIVASTATIRRARNQIRQLYARSLAVFPPPALSARDSFFAKEQSIDQSMDETAGRLYVGVNAPGSSSKTLLVRVYAVLLAAAEAEISANPRAADPYGTLVGYFNSLRALGGAKRLVEDDVKLVRLKYLRTARGFPDRRLSDPQELTSRIDSWKIPSLLKQLDRRFPRTKSDWPVDVLLATNMISVGVDINRLGLMVVTGQPKTTAEYIQATSRVGRKHPGLVVTMYNWLGARDLSHYERFISYHAALYRYVEAISVTPFSSRALDRALRGVFASMVRLSTPGMSTSDGARRFQPTAPITDRTIESLVARAAQLVGQANAERVRARLLAHRDEWAALARDPLLYSWLNESARPPNNERILLRTAGTKNDGTWSTPGSLREVEPTAGFFIDEGEGAT